MSKSIYRYKVGFDGPVTLGLTSDPVQVANTEAEYGLEFWAEYLPGVPEVERTFEVFGTGHPVPDNARYIGTAPRTRLGLVFHLYELV